MTDDQITAEEHRLNRMIGEKLSLGEIDAREFLIQHAMISQRIAALRGETGDQRADVMIKLDFLASRLISILASRHSSGQIRDIDYAAGISDIRYWALTGAAALAKCS